MYGYKKGIGTMIVAMIVLTGCTTPPMTLQIQDTPLTLEGERQRNYAITDAIAYVHREDDETVGSMMIQEYERVRSDQERDSYRKTSSYPHYRIKTTKTITNSCDQSYTYMTAKFVSDPVSEKTIYMALIRILHDTSTTIVSYTTPTKSYRSQWLDDRKDTYGCIEL